MKLTKAEKRMVARVAKRHRQAAAQLRKLAREQARLVKRLGLK